MRWLRWRRRGPDRGETDADRALAHADAVIARLQDHADRRRHAAAATRLEQMRLRRDIRRVSWPEAAVWPERPRGGER